jgi:hypothetical protein
MSISRTNNSIEGWHIAFAIRVAVARPTISKLTDRIRREQSEFEIDIAQILQGHGPKPKKKKRYLLLDEKIQRPLDDYRSVDMARFLKNLAATDSF